MNDLIEDRGNIKWRGMLMTEHVKEINSLRARELYTERPQLNQWELQEIQYELEVAYKRKCQTSVRCWVKGIVHLYFGVIEEIDVDAMTISIEVPFGMNQLSVKDIVSVQMAE